MKIRLADFGMAAVECQTAAQTGNVLIWSARTCPRFETTRHVASKKAATCRRTPNWDTTCGLGNLCERTRGLSECERVALTAGAGQMTILVLIFRTNRHFMKVARPKAATATAAMPRGLFFAGLLAVDPGRAVLEKFSAGLRSFLQRRPAGPAERRLGQAPRRFHGNLERLERHRQQRRFGLRRIYARFSAGFWVPLVIQNFSPRLRFSFWVLAPGLFSGN